MTTFLMWLLKREEWPSRNELVELPCQKSPVLWAVLVYLNYVWNKL